MLSVIDVSLSGIVTAVIFMILGGAILAALWWLIGYSEASFGGPPMFWKVVRFAFVFMVVLLLIAILLHLMGSPLVNFHAQSTMPESLRTAFNERPDLDGVWLVKK